MSYGHADKIARSGTEPGNQRPPTDRSTETTKADTPGDLAPDWYALPDLAPVLTGRDIGALYRWLNDAGVPQRRIAALTGTTQSQVADIIAGRRARVQVYDVLVRTAAGLKIPRERMGLSFWGPDGKWYGPPDAYPVEVTVANTPKGVSADVLRRYVLALGGIAAVSVPVTGLGELVAELSGPPPEPLPSQLFEVHVAQVRDLTQRLWEAGKAYGSNPEASSAMAASAMRLLDVPGAGPVKRALMGAVAELQIHAGWAGSDAGLYRRAMWHYARALELATEAGDAYLQAHALTLAGFVTVEHGHPDDGLKMLQLAQVTAWRIPADDRRGKAVQAWAQADSATALAALGEPQAAYREVGKARELWTPTRTDPTGDLDYVAACLEIKRRRLDVAQTLAVASVRRWEGNSRLGRTRSGIVLATVHVKAGEPSGLQLAHNTITDVTKLTSVRARQRLLPLAEALEARSGSDARELARMARQAAA